MHTQEPTSERWNSTKLMQCFVYQGERCSVYRDVILRHPFVIVTIWRYKDSTLSGKYVAQMVDTAI